MKHTALVLAFAVLCAVAAPQSYAAPAGSSSKVVPSHKMVTKKFRSAMKFTKIEVYHMVHLIVEDRSDDVITVCANENVMPYVKLSVFNGKLTAMVSEEVKFRESPKVEIRIPNNGRISNVEVTAASRVDIEPCIRGEWFSAEVTGASALRASVVASNCNVDVVGASSADLSFEGGILELEVSGASNFDGDVHAIRCDIEVIGASKAGIRGSSDSAEIGVCGASKLYGAVFRTKVCSVEASGASSVSVQCTESLSVEANGASSVNYSGGCKLSSVSSGGMSSIKQR